MSSNDFIHFALPEIGPEEIDEVVEVLKSGWLTTGKKARQFEQEFAEFIGVKHALAVNSATAGLHLSLEAAGIGAGDKVLTTPFTFTATAEVCRYLNADPVFVDIDARTFNLDVEQAINIAENDAAIKAILPVHFAGQACDMQPLLEFCRARNIRLIEDAAHALPTTYKGKTIGSFSDASVFSFYATKTITTGEGGMITTNNDDIAKRVSVMRLHGIDRDVFNRYTSDKPAWMYDVVAAGYKYNLPDLAAAVGIHQLRKLNKFHARRADIAQRYSKAFADLPLILPQPVNPEDTHAWHLYVLRLEDNALKIDRDEFIKQMNKRGVGTSVHFIPLHLMSYWQQRYNYQPNDFPVANRVFQSCLSLPLYTRMTDEQVERVIHAVEDICTSYAK
jgi:dTDP-4-amino-4,6-dideoxygalactose transaminase